MEQHENQKQHSVANVYLKQFGFRKDDRWYVLALDKTIDILEDKRTSMFSIAVNEFDFPSEDYTERRH